MLRITTIFLLAGLLSGCGEDSKQDEPSSADQNRDKLEAAIAQWGDFKKEKNAQVYSYTIRQPRSLVQVDVDAGTDKLLCRKLIYKLTEDGPSPEPEKGAEVNKNDWGGAPKAWTMPELHSECRRVIKEDPDASVIRTQDGSLLWCQGAFGYPNGQWVNVLGWTINQPKCN